MPRERFGDNHPTLDLARIRTIAGLDSLAGDGLASLSAGAGIVINGNIVGMSGNTILLYDSGGAVLSEYPVTQAGLVAAFAAASSGDIVLCPRQMPIACTSGVTIPASVILHSANLTFSGFSGIGVTLSNQSHIENSSVIYDGTGYGAATGVSAIGVTLATKITDTYINVHSATSNYGVRLKGISTYNGPEMHGSFVEAQQGNSNVAIEADDYSDVTYCYGASDGGSAVNIGVELIGTHSGIDAPKLLHCWFLGGTVGSPGAWGGQVNAGNLGRAVYCYFQGVVGGVNIGAGGTLESGDNIWNSITNAGTLTNLGQIGTFPWFNVRDYGATGNGSSDDTAAISAAIAAIPATGGVLYFPGGVYLTSGGFALSKPVMVRGDGNSTQYDSSNVVISKVQCNHATNSLFTVSAYGCSFKDIYLNNTNATPSAGAGITVSGGGDNMHFDNITVDGFYICVDMQDGFQWMMDGCYLLRPMLYALKMAHTDLPDGGDQSISNSYFLSGPRNSTAGIRIESGGGPKIVNCKWNGWPGGYGFNYCIDVAVAASITTVDLMVANCSIENYKVSGIHVTSNASKPSKWSEWIINGNEFGAFAYASTYAIDFTIDALHDVGDIVITDNIFLDPHTPATAAINLVNVNSVYIGADNVLSDEYGSYATLVAQSGCTNVTIEGAGGGVATDTIWDAKGDLAVATAADTAVRLAVGSDGQFLSADSAQTTGVAWANPFSPINVYNETVTADGINTTYYLANYAAPGTIRVMVNGIRQPVTDDVAPSDTVTFATLPALGDLLMFDYEMDQS